MAVDDSAVRDQGQAVRKHLLRLGGETRNNICANRYLWSSGF